MDESLCKAGTLLLMRSGDENVVSIYETLKPRIRYACRDMLRGSEYTRGLCWIRGAVYNNDDCARPAEYRALKAATQRAFAAPTSRVWAKRTWTHRSVLAVKNLSQMDDAIAEDWSCWPLAVRQQAALRWYRWALRVCQHADRIMQESSNATTM